jgi:YidC/Oxa1 family membrane protein insertase
VERRLVFFLVTATVIMMGWMFVSKAFLPQPPVPQQEEQEDGEGQADDPDEVVREDGEIKPPPKKDGEQPSEDDSADEPDTGPEVRPDAEPKLTRPKVPQQWIALGSADQRDPYRMLVILSNKGAAVEQIELNNRRFRDLEDRAPGDLGGHIGYLAPTVSPNGRGLIVNVVGSGTPAAVAVCAKSGVPPGLELGDVILSAGSVEPATPEELARAIAAVRPGQQLPLTVMRGGGGEPQMLNFTVIVGTRPLAVVRREFPDIRNRHGRIDPEKAAQPRVPNPLSYLLTIEKIQLGDKDASIARGDREIKGLPSLYNENWEVVRDEQKPDEVEFHFVLSDDDLKQVGVRGPLRIVKRFRLNPVPAKQQDNPDFRAFHLDYEVEIYNLSDEPQRITYRQQGPTGMPLEGWWFTNKTHPRKWSAVGTRDVMFSLDSGKHEGHNLVGCPQIVKQSDKHPDDPETKLYVSENAAPLRYAGGDTQYFSTALLPDREDPAAGDYVFPAAVAFPVAEIDPLNKKRTNVTLQLSSRPLIVEPDPDAPLRQQFTLFAGPKVPEVLEQYDLGQTRVFGWFSWVAKPMVSVLHFFYRMTGSFSYGLAIIMLTVLVRACMFPLSRKQVQSAQKMQELAPELKKLTEKYKDDMQKKSAAQQELFKKHNYNPLGGCVLVFFQLPVFIGLYRGLSVDMELRQAPLIPGLQWCSNLAAPDQLWHWQYAFPEFFDFLVGPNGFLGPFLNVLPLITIVLFLAQQKMFTPPPTDDQQRMQQKVMSFMMLFIGILFFRVPSGLCIYFIASSLWGLTERKLLPKLKKADDQAVVPAKVKAEVAAKKAMRKKGKRRR